MDLGRLLPESAGIVLDVGCGLGTNTAAMARSATHVFALDRSPSRAALTAARVGAEGLDNVTVIHADATTLPVGDDVCDVVMMVGVLEWVGAGDEAHRRRQRQVLDEVARVLKPGGRLLLGIENRWGIHYFGGAREEHTGLRYSSLLPRRVANSYSKLARGRPITTFTYSRRQLRRILSQSGFRARFCYPLPSYSGPQWCFDESEVGPGKRFYVRHVFHYSSVVRRIAGRVLQLTPSAALRRTLPCFWVVAGKTMPEPLPAVVTGSQYKTADLKAIDLAGSELRRFSRESGALLAGESLLPGWNARRWVTRPLSAGVRHRRLAWTVNAAAALLEERAATPASELELSEAAGESERGLMRLRTHLTRDAEVWCIDRVSAALNAQHSSVLEHGDFLLTNLIVEGKRLCAIDVTHGRQTVPGLDATTLLVDALGVVRGRRRFQADAALCRPDEVPTVVRSACARLVAASLVEQRVQVALRLRAWSDFPALVVRS